MEVRKVQWRSHSTHLEQKKSEIGCIEKSKEQFPFTNITSLSRRHNSVPRQPFLAHDFSYGGNWGWISEHLASQAVWDAAKESHCIHTLSRILRCEQRNWGGWWAAIWTPARAQNKMYQIDVDSTNFFVDAIRRPIHKLPGMRCLQIPNWTKGTPNALHTLLICFLIPCLYPYSYPWWWREWAIADG